MNLKISTNNVAVSPLMNNSLTKKRYNLFKNRANTSSSLYKNNNTNPHIIYEWQLKCSKNEVESKMEEEIDPNICPSCGIELSKAPWGCDKEGRIAGGLGAIIGFDWWPIKVYKPCPAYQETGKRYKRKGQITNEILFGKKDMEK